MVKPHKGVCVVQLRLATTSSDGLLIWSAAQTCRLLKAEEELTGVVMDHTQGKGGPAGGSGGTCAAPRGRRPPRATGSPPEDAGVVIKAEPTGVVMVHTQGEGGSAGGVLVKEEPRREGMDERPTKKSRRTVLPTFKVQAKESTGLLHARGQSKVPLTLFSHSLTLSLSRAITPSLALTLTLPPGQVRDPSGPRGGRGKHGGRLPWVPKTYARRMRNAFRGAFCHPW